MASLEELRSERIKKLQNLKTEGINPYPIVSHREYSLAEALLAFPKLSKRKKPIVLVGRVLALRKQGGLIFLNFSDGTETLQAMMKKDDLKNGSFQLFADNIDIGDFVEFTGSLFITKRKEKSILVKGWRMLAKSLRPLPDQWAGLSDVEERFRKRYLDTLMSAEVKERFVMRSRMITTLRSLLDKEGFLEVETPILQHHAGGATATPFTTHHNALDVPLHLRIAPELYLKELLIGGFPKVYEMGRNFRNEGIDATHNPEFTMLEFYEAYSDTRKLMVFMERMIKATVKTLFKKQNIPYGDNTIDFSKKFQVVSYLDLLKRYALITHPESITKEEATTKAHQLGVPVDKGDGVQKILDNIYKKSCRPKLIQPTFVIDYPTDYLPLAKRKEEGGNLVDAFQLVIAGIEVGKAFSELNDPLDQAERFKNQEEQRKAGDKEAQTRDDAFLEAMEYGMPPAGGVGIGIERLVLLFTNTHNVREVILFPTLRPKG
ncbi:MAG: lysine--tRNA ligase [Patescibacteria group bacterium]